MSGYKYEMYRRERERGLTYAEIAQKYGVSRQNVCMACCKSNPARFQYHGKEKIIYPNLRNWMNNNKISMNEMLRRLGLGVSYKNAQRLRGNFGGKTQPRKLTIDKLIEITGMPYEQLFMTDQKG